MEVAERLAPEAGADTPRSSGLAASAFCAGILSIPI